MKINGNKYLKTCCPCCYFILCTDHNCHKKLKGFFGFFYGIIIGIVIHYAILIDLEFSERKTFFIGFAIATFLGFGNASSIQVRCITLLTLPSFCGKSGRGVLKTIVLAYVLGGPFMTISNNAKEAVRVFGCTTTLAYNLTKTRYDLMVKPFQDALYQMKQDTYEVAETLRSVDEVIRPIVKEVEGGEKMAIKHSGMSLKLWECLLVNLFLINTALLHFSSCNGRFSHSSHFARMSWRGSTFLEGKGKAGFEKSEEKDEIREKIMKQKKTKEEGQNEGAQYEAKYKKRLRYHCQDVVQKGAKRCWKMFADAWKKCTENVSVFVAWIVCWPLKLNYICNTAEAYGGEAVCDTSEEIRPGFGEGYRTLKAVQTSTANGRGRRVNIQFEVKNPMPKINVKSAADVAQKITKTFQDKKTIFTIVILFIKRLLALIFLRVVYKASQYHEKYLMDIEYDNKYITKYFRKIDERRRERGQRTLLPMKKIERQNYVDPYESLPLNEERKRIFGQSFKLILEMITATTFILLDRLFYETLDIVSKHALIEYSQTGEQDMTISVKGTGMVANLVRAIVNGFNCKRRVKVIHSNKRCLPKPIMLSNYYLYKIYGTYFLIWVFILLEGYTQRLNRFICAYFYPKREKKRVLFLYNETLKRRIGFFKYMRGRIRRKAREINLSFEANILLALRLRRRKKFDWLRYLPVGKRKCLICGEPEPSKPGIFRECATLGCDFLHCQECWVDVGEICYGCQPIESDEDMALEEDD